jgi:hypothetical protein
MKKTILSFLAAGLLTASGVSAGLYHVPAGRRAVFQHDNNPVALTPQQATDNLVRDLALNEKQAKKLLKLNQQYADLIANPRFKGRPQPVKERKETGVDGSTGATQHAQSEEVRTHIRQQHERRNAYNAALKKILTKEQYAKYTSHK